MITIAMIIDDYVADHNSPHHNLSYSARLNAGRYLSRIKKDRGSQILSGITRRTLTYWHKRWCEGGKIATGRAFMGQLRALCLYGVVSRDDAECNRLLRTLDN